MGDGSKRAEHWRMAEDAIRQQVGDVEFMSVERIQEITRWSAQMCTDAAMKRLSDTDSEDTMFAIGITEILEDGEVAVLTPQGTLERVLDTESSEPAFDVIAFIETRRAELDAAVAVGERSMPGTLHLLDVRDGDIDDVKAGNIFSNATQAAYVQQEERVLEIPDWLKSSDELAYYGFALVPIGRPFLVRSPIGIAPLIPLYVGTRYNEHIRNGYYIESHGGTGPVHFWAPMQAECEGFVTAAKLHSVEEGGMHHFSFARIKIPLGTMLVCDAHAWHCDGTLSGGVHTTTFGFHKGPKGDEEHDIVTIQPLRTRSGEELLPPPDQTRG